MDIKALEALGITKDELLDRIVDRVSDNLLRESYLDEDGEEAGDMPTAFQRVMQDRVTKKVDQAIDAIAGRHVLPNVESYVENLCLQETNKWGERTKEAYTFVEYLTKRAEEYLSEKVNYEGKTRSESSGYSWEGTQTRVAHLVHRHLHFSIETAMKQAIAQANAVIVGGLEETVKIKLEEISKQLKVSVKTK